MAKSMTASTEPMTDGQVEILIDKFRAAMRKHRGEFGSDAVQQTLGVENLGMELLEPFRKRVEAVSNPIVRHVKVDPKLTPQQVLDVTGGWKQDTDKSVVESMPRGEEGDGEGDVYFFQVDLRARGGYISDDDLKKEFNLRGFKPAGPYYLAQVNADDPAFADDHPNVTHWKDANGKWCYAAFCRWGVGRSVVVGRGGRGWGDRWWFAGLRK